MLGQHSLLCVNGRGRGVGEWEGGEGWANGRGRGVGEWEEERDG